MPTRNARRLVGPGTKIVITIFQCLMIEALAFANAPPRKSNWTLCNDPVALAPGRHRLKAMRFSSGRLVWEDRDREARHDRLRSVRPPE